LLNLFVFFGEGEVIEVHESGGLLGGIQEWTCEQGLLVEIPIN
jgi:hypothetical protein